MYNVGSLVKCPLDVFFLFISFCNPTYQTYVEIFYVK